MKIIIPQEFKQFLNERNILDSFRRNVFLTRFKEQGMRGRNADSVVDLNKFKKTDYFQKSFMIDDSIEGFKFWLRHETEWLLSFLEFSITISGDIEEFLKKNNIYDMYILNVKKYLFENVSDKKNYKISIEHFEKGFDFQYSFEGRDYWNEYALQYFSENNGNEFNITFNLEFKQYLIDHNLYDIFVDDLKEGIYRQSKERTIHVETFTPVTNRYNKRGMEFWLTKKQQYDADTCVTYEGGYRLSRDVFNYLTKYDLLKMYMDNVIRIRGLKDEVLVNLSSYFSWDSSKQGGEFWEKHSKEYDKYRRGY